ncbi:MAG TPA: hypothetical protein VIG08_08920 [Gemmatimonadales bacterium]|jgi:hypothetical protein
MMRLLAAVLFLPALAAQAQEQSADPKDAPVAVRFAEGAVHGFVVLRSESGTILAHGDLLQTPKGGAITTEMVLRFADGSLLDETVVFTQHDVFTMLSYHLVQRGPAFDRDIDFELVGARQAYRLITKDHEDGKEEADSGTFDLPADVYNGMVLTVLKNLSARDSATIHMVALTPKPRMIQLELRATGEQKVLSGAHRETTVHWVIHPKLGALTGFFAKLLGKTPPDNHAWIVTDDVPAFVRFEGPLYLKGPIWRIELAVPAWPGSDSK